MNLSPAKEQSQAPLKKNKKQIFKSLHIHEPSHGKFQQRINKPKQGRNKVNSSAMIFTTDVRDLGDSFACCVFLLLHLGLSQPCKVYGLYILHLWGRTPIALSVMLVCCMSVGFMLHLWGTAVV